jgi:hypothetical protein
LLRPSLYNCRTKRLHFPGRQFSPVPGLETAVVERADANAPQRSHRVPDGFTHPPHLPISPLANSQPQRALAIASRTEQRDICGKGSPAIQHDSLPEAFDRFGVGCTRDAYLVRPFNAMSRMHELRSEVSVIRQQQQSFGVVVEPPDGVNVFPHLAQQIDHRRPALRIRARAHIPGRFVQQDVARALRRPQAPAVYADVVVVGVRFRAHHPHDFAVERHASLGDQLFGGAPGGHPGLGENLL